MTHTKTLITRNAICSRNSQVLIPILIIVFLLAAQPHTLAESPKQQPTAKFISRGELRDVVYSPDGTQLAVMTLEGLWLYGEDHPEGQLLYEEHVSPLSAVAWSPDGSIIALGARDGNVRLLASLDGHLLGTLESLTSDDSVFDLAFSPRDQMLAVAYLQHLRIWDVERQRIISARETSGGSSHGLIFSTDGTLLAHSVCCGSVSIWSMPAFTLRDELTTDRESAAAIAFVPQTSRLVTVDATQTLRLWQPGVGVTTIPHVAMSGPLTFSPDGSHMIVTGRGEVQDRVIDADSVKTVKSVSIPRANIPHVNKLAFSPQGDRIAVMSDETLFELAYPSLEAVEMPGHYTEFVEDLAVSPVGDYLLSAHLLTGTRLWTTEGDSVYSLSNDSSVRERVRIASDWSLMVSSEAAGLVTRNPITSDQIEVMQDSVRNWYSIEISPTGQYVAAISDSFRLKLWDTSTGALIGETDAGYLASQLAFTSDSKLLISEQVDPTELRLWNTENLEQINAATIRTDARFTDISVSPDGKVFAASLAGESPVTLLRDTESLEAIHSLSGHSDWIVTSAFSPDGRMLATGSRDGTVRVWRVDSGEQVALFDQHTDWVNEVAFSRDGRVLASTSRDGTLRLWDVATMSELAVLNGDADEVTSIAFFADSNAIASAGRDGAIRVWDIEPILSDGGN